MDDDPFVGWQEPRSILETHVERGATVLEAGPGMGSFTLELARLVGPAGRVVAVALQPKMLEALRKRRYVPRSMGGSRPALPAKPGSASTRTAVATATLVEASTRRLGYVKSGACS
jgi:predicted methyltransferase